MNWCLILKWYYSIIFKELTLMLVNDILSFSPLYARIYIFLISSVVSLKCYSGKNDMNLPLHFWFWFHMGLLYYPFFLNRHYRTILVFLFWVSWLLLDITWWIYCVFLEFPGWDDVLSFGDYGPAPTTFYSLYYHEWIPGAL